MYEADDLTENTEEIILKRQRESVKAAEIGLELTKISHKRQMEVSLPREAVTLEREANSSAIGFKEQEQNIPRILELKRIALEDARVGAKRGADNLAKLQAEKGQFVIKPLARSQRAGDARRGGRETVGCFHDRRSRAARERGEEGSGARAV